MKCNIVGKCSRRFLLILATLFICSMQVNLFAQNQRVTLDARDMTLNEIFKRIKNQTNLSVIYNVDDINPNKRVSISSSDQPIEEVLSLLLEDEESSLSYVIKDNYIVIAKNVPAQQ